MEWNPIYKLQIRIIDLNWNWSGLPKEQIQSTITFDNKECIEFLSKEGMI